jgi:hypothetical protein
VTSVFAVASLAVVTGAWLFGPARVPERLLFLVAAIALLVMTPMFIGVGAAFLVAGVVVHLLTRRRNRADGGSGADAGTPAAQDTQVAPSPPSPPSSPVGSTAAPVDRPRTER